MAFFYFWKMEQDKKEFELMVSEGKRAWYELMLAAIFYSVTVYLILLTIYHLISKNSFGLFIIDLYKIVGTGVYSFGMGIMFSVTKTIFIDIDENKLISRYVVGKIKYDVKSKVPHLEYISVFNKNYDAPIDNAEFEVNLWYNKNHHYKMFSFSKKNDAFEFAKTVSNKLNIDLLDATEKGNFKWVDKNKI